jgi:hypothetical protein
MFLTKGTSLQKIKYPLLILIRISSLNSEFKSEDF